VILATVDGCDETTGVVCDVVEQVVEDPGVARAVDLVLGAPLTVLAIILTAIVVHRVTSALVRRTVRRYEHEIHRRIQRATELGTEGASPQAATRRLQRLHAVGGAARSGLSLAIWVTAGLLAVAQFVNLGPVLAGAGLAGVIIGFGAQAMIGDLLAGFSMLVEDQYGVGDWIDVDGKIGEVELVGLRRTSFRDLDGVVWHVPNGRITMVGNLSQRWARATLEIPLPLDVDVAQARRVVTSVAGGLVEDERWADDIIGPPEIWGVTEWSDRGLRLRLVIPTRPLRNWDVNRQLRERLKHAFDREGIRMPVPMQKIGGMPRSAPVRLTGVEFEDEEADEVAEFGPTATDRFEAETGWVDRYPDQRPDQRPGDVPPRSTEPPVRPD